MASMMSLREAFSPTITLKPSSFSASLRSRASLTALRSGVVAYWLLPMRGATRSSAAPAARHARAHTAPAKTRNERNRFNDVCTMARTPQAKNYRSKGPAVRKTALAGERGELGEVGPLGGESPPCRLGILGRADVVQQESVHDAVGKTPRRGTRLLDLRLGCRGQGLETRFPDDPFRSHHGPLVGRGGGKLDRRPRRRRHRVALPDLVALGVEENDREAPGGGLGAPAQLGLKRSDACFHRILQHGLGVGGARGEAAHAQARRRGAGDAGGDAGVATRP